MVDRTKLIKSEDSNDVKSKLITIKVHTPGLTTLDRTAYLLSKFADAYNGLSAIESFNDTVKRNPDFFNNSKYSKVVFNRIRMFNPNTPIALKSVVFNSPGWWEMIGKLNPIESIRVFYTTVKEAKKDDEYRNIREDERLFLENTAAELAIYKEYLAICKENNFDEEITRTIASVYITRPLRRIIDLDNTNEITNIEKDEETN